MGIEEIDHERARPLSTLDRVREGQPRRGRGDFRLGGFGGGVRRADPGAGSQEAEPEGAAPPTPAAIARSRSLICARDLIVFVMRVTPIPITINHSPPFNLHRPCMLKPLVGLDSRSICIL